MTELVPTPNDCPLPRRRADFATFTEAVDYAARSLKGLNFHDARGQLERVYPYSQLRSDALGMAYRLVAQGVAEGGGSLQGDGRPRPPVIGGLIDAVLRRRLFRRYFVAHA